MLGDHSFSCSIPRRIEYELVEGKVAKGEGEHDGNRAIQFLAGVVWQGAGPITSLSSFKPSGVSSYSQEKIKMSGKPMASTMTTSLIDASDNPNTGKSVSTIWMSNHIAAR